ncbi:2-isopropylmalate synthase (Alpha-isopropylmalate synthase) (Alpha-IPM synthetase) [Entomophthora muscae]|uniref:2-isopropylmalate synthase (Alpha-isopropylmalate synthase) (Alpha-IPM synthetase) n=1 Tax=Entomophthora muscae TaxID=34485 RepID=A0ACC2TBE2_9FUNG|nr:2-isopropylmalate synthase (Alpha-isopropylmalate synthase) (Alpha-IPM synthetase) [Entomophthora muscae]
MSQAEKPNIVFFDTTLRDGEQSPGVTLSVQEKLDIARQLSRMGINVLEAGFPVASEGDFRAVQAIAKNIGPLTEGRKDGVPMTICGLARAVNSDIKRCFDAIEPAPRKRIHTFLATSDIHLKYKLKISREQCIERAVAAVKYARSLCDDVEFSPEDAGRSEKEFLCTVLAAVIEAGATTLNIPDTVGYNTPEEYTAIMKHLIQNTPGSDKVIWSTHCHNDLGLATANTLAGVVAGARQVEVTINGIGERAGNTAFEEVCMALYTHPTLFPVGIKHIDPSQIYRVSKMVSNLTGMSVQSNKAIVGANAFAHESGIHQDGVLKHQETYEIIRPEVVGVPSNSLVLGKHSGRNALRTHLEKLGVSHLTEEEFQSVFERFKKIADSKRQVMDEDLMALLDDQTSQSGLEHFRLVNVQVFTTCGTSATATVRIQTLASADPPTYETHEDAATAPGAVDAIFSALHRQITLEHHMVGYDVHGVTGGSDALGAVTVKLVNFKDGTPNPKSPTIPSQPNGFIERTLQGARIFKGQATDPDVLLAGAKAYINALNRIALDKAMNISSELDKSGP